MHDVHNTCPPSPMKHNHKGLALCSRCHLVWAREGTPVGPGKDTHGTLVPGKRGGRVWPHTNAPRANYRLNDACTRQHKTQVRPTNMMSESDLVQNQQVLHSTSQQMMTVRCNDGKVSRSTAPNIERDFIISRTSFFSKRNQTLQNSRKGPSDGL